MPVPDAPAALCARLESTQVSHHSSAETIRHSLRDGVTASFVLSLVIGLCCHHRRRNAKHCRQLDASVEAPKPHDFAVRKPHRSSGDTICGPSHPALHVRDDASAPPDERETGGLLKVICPTAQAECWGAHRPLRIRKQKSDRTRRMSALGPDADRSQAEPDGRWEARPQVICDRCVPCAPNACTRKAHCPALACSKISLG